MTWVCWRFSLAWPEEKEGAKIIVKLKSSSGTFQSYLAVSPFKIGTIETHQVLFRFTVSPPKPRHHDTTLTDIQLGPQQVFPALLELPPHKHHKPRHTWTHSPRWGIVNPGSGNGQTKRRYDHRNEMNCVRKFWIAEMRNYCATKESCDSKGFYANGIREMSPGWVIVVKSSFVPVMCP